MAALIVSSVCVSPFRVSSAFPPRPASRTYQSNPLFFGAHKPSSSASSPRNLICAPPQGKHVREDYLVKKMSAKGVEELVRGERKVPLIIDFYATWCGPCILMAQELEMSVTHGILKMLAEKLRRMGMKPWIVKKLVYYVNSLGRPKAEIMMRDVMFPEIVCGGFHRHTKLAVEYESNAMIIKVDTDDEYEFAQDMQVRGLPTLYFISPDPSKEAIRTEGLIPLQMMRDIINNEM